jgi:hypothetical protein
MARRNRDQTLMAVGSGPAHITLVRTAEYDWQYRPLKPCT